jgi:vacuolar-type H+-ATPase subunit D/Vma8
MDDDRSNTRRLKEYKAYKEVLERNIETEKDENQLSIFKHRLKSVKRRIVDVEYEVKNNG